MTGDNKNKYIKGEKEMSEQPFYSLKNPDFCMSKRATALLGSYDNKKTASAAV